ncbi:MAG TPA: MFS transporter [Gammaproteobacteria bacterium]
MKLLSPPYGRLLMPVYVPTLLNSTSQMALLILLPLYALDAGYNAAFAATIVGLRGVGILLFDIPAGVLVARFGEKAILLTGLALILVGNMLLAAAAHPWLLMLAAVLLGAGISAWMIGRQSYIVDTCASEEVGRAIAVMAGLQRAGMFLGPAAGGLLAANVGYAPTFIAGAAVALLAGLLVLSFTKNVRPTDAAAEAGFRGAIEVLRSHGRVFATAGVASFSLQLMRAARELLVPLFGAAVGLNVAEIGIIYSVSSALDMSLFYPVGVWIDRHGRKWSAVSSSFVFSVALALLPWVVGYYSLLAAGLLLGLANGLGTGIVMVMGADLSRATPHRGQFLGVWRLIGDVGVSVAPLVTGALTGIASLAAASLCVAGLGFVGTAMMMSLVPETLRRSSKSAT